MKIKELISQEKQQYQALIGLSIGAAAMTGIVYCYDDLVLLRFTGGVNPLAASIIIIFLGFLLLTLLLSEGWFSIYKRESLKRLFRISALALLFVPISVLVDVSVGFPADMNISFPESLLFYPAIGFFAEILFHVLPLSILLISLTSIFKSTDYRDFFVICGLIVACLEPGYQVIPMFSSNHFPLWAVALIWLNLFLFNVAQLIIFKRYDFISMYSFRLAYYIIWHILWGNVRLRLLF